MLHGTWVPYGDIASVFCTITKEICSFDRIITRRELKLIEFVYGHFFFKIILFEMSF